MVHLSKKFASLFMIVMLLAFSQSAFASNMGTNAIGIGDNEATAIPLTPQFLPFEFYLSNSTDLDWYQWKNESSTHQVMWAGLNSPSNGNYKMKYKIKFVNGEETTLFTAVPGVENGYTYFDHIILPAGATVYLQISSVSFNSSDRFYSLRFNYY
ncbi:hypothetical protein M3223_11825 [Paenibacillus pasadenensis]|uniref:hypothetical protein n=1 Tax=Paenibacillus pasadenensis TaxID=217090 RepID=UPI00203B6870|nr:hypothetical protein [Paenibacillus pasadenensis]MCM3748041.1 hypothetical protein [Paenibacillus pasadenensis]